MTDAIYLRDAYATECDATVVAAGDGKVVLDRTVFYAAGGGQPGDRGELVLEDGGRVAVVDTVKGEGGVVAHVLSADAIPPVPGTRVRACIDWQRRYRLMRYHTCLHLLCAVVGAPVTGGRIAEDKAHLDFDIEMEKLVAEDIEARLNGLIVADTPVVVGEIDDATLDANPGLVKTMSVQPPRSGFGAHHRDSRRGPAALRRHPSAPHRGDRRGTGDEDPFRRQAQQARDGGAGLSCPPKGRPYCGRTNCSVSTGLPK
jgi:misacylated tRNA(Ala) deacylase